MKQQLTEVKKLQKIAGIIKEGEQAEKELYNLKQQFLPSFEEYVELYGIVAREDDEYTDLEKDFARQLEDVLFKFKKGVI